VWQFHLRTTILERGGEPAISPHLTAERNASAWPLQILVTVKMPKAGFQERKDYQFGIAAMCEPDACLQFFTNPLFQKACVIVYKF
jgi:hypothetical protein